MTIKFLCLNIYMGHLMEDLLKYIAESDYDILCFQEVSGGDVSFNKKDNFELIKNLGYNGELIKVFESIRGGYFGQATFYKKNIKLIKRKDLWLSSFREIDIDIKRDFTKDPKAVLDTQFLIDGKNINVLNAHLAWDKNAGDSEEKIRQGEVLIDYVKKIEDQFIVAGDFNLIPESIIVKSMNGLATNLNGVNNVKNTLNLNVHRFADRLADGLEIDYIFASRNLSIEEFNLINTPNLSDHLGLATKFKF